MKKYLIIILLVSTLLASSIASAEYRETVPNPFPAYEGIEYTNALIRSRGLDWTAGETSVSRLSPSEQKALLVQDRPESDVEVGEFHSEQRHPMAIDWRDKDGDNWLTSVKDQLACGSCWAYSAVTVVESRVKIGLNNSSYSIDLSEQDLVSCSSAGNCEDGGWEGDALEYIKNTGIASEECFPYNATDQSCGNKCENWEDDAVKVLNYSMLPASTTEIKQAISDYGPVTVYMHVFADFLNYTSGVYAWVTGGPLGWHAVSIVGYDESGEYWIAKNSWGTGWGEDGYFRINYSENVMDRNGWTPLVLGEFFLDESYVVTSNDIDLDSIDDATDNCPYATNIDQIDQDNDSMGDSCDIDLDGDTLNNTIDNCPFVANLDQADLDEDGVGDLCDSIVEVEVDSNIANLSILINGSSIYDQNISGIIPILFEDESNNTILEFNWNFSTIFNMSGVEITKQESNDTGSIIISGLDLGDETKTVYLDKLSSSNSVCIKDADITNITEISGDCTGTNETSVACPGSSGVYSCVLASDKYKVSGLSHSGVIEHYVAPPPVPPSPGGGGSSGGSGGGRSTPKEVKLVELATPEVVEESISSDAVIEEEPAEGSKLTGQTVRGGQIAGLVITSLIVLIILGVVIVQHKKK